MQSVFSGTSSRLVDVDHVRHRVVCVRPCIGISIDRTFCISPQHVSKEVQFGQLDAQTQAVPIVRSRQARSARPRSSFGSGRRPPSHTLNTSESSKRMPSCGPVISPGGLGEVVDAAGLPAFCGSRRGRSSRLVVRRGQSETSVKGCRREGDWLDRVVHAAVGRVQKRPIWSGPGSQAATVASKLFWVSSARSVAADGSSHRLFTSCGSCSRS